MTRAVVCVPRRADQGQRDLLWAYCRAWWERQFPDLPVVEGRHEFGPFNAAAARNSAAAAAGDWDVAFFCDADTILEAALVRQAIDRATATGAVVFARDRWLGLSREGTAAVLAGGDPAEAPVESPVLRTSSVQCAVTRSAWETLGGFDERFRGWGGEDGAFLTAAQALVGIEVLPGPAYHLWHPESPERARYERSISYQVRREQYPPRGSDREALAAVVAESKRLLAGITLLVMTDGRRDCLEQTLASAAEHLHGPIERRVIHDDSGDPAYHAWLIERFPDYVTIGHGRRLGYAEAMRFAWSYLVAPKRTTYAPRYVFHLEDDFRFERDVDLAAMTALLERRPYLTEIALLRPAWFEGERRAGGIMERHPDGYTRQSDEAASWIEWRGFTLNPCLYRRDLAARGWPAGAHSETVFSDVLASEPERRAGYWGNGETWVTHIGAERVGYGY